MKTVRRRLVFPHTVLNTSFSRCAYTKADIAARLEHVRNMQHHVVCVLALNCTRCFAAWAVDVSGNTSSCLAWRRNHTASNFARRQQAKTCKHA